VWVSEFFQALSDISLPQEHIAGAAKLLEEEGVRLLLSKKPEKIPVPEAGSGTVKVPT
jgi:hypothetical protein